MWNSGPSRLLLHQRPFFSQQHHYNQEELAMPAMQRRHSLDLDTVERNESNMRQPFLAIRRDSLHCLGHSPSG
jgi:hypothetical protein